MYKINKWLFKFIIEAEYDYTVNKSIKHLDKYKLYEKRRTYLHNLYLEMNNEEVSK